MAMSKSIHIPIDHREFPVPYVETERIRNLELEFERIWSENGLQKNQTQPIQPSAPSLSTINTVETRTSRNLITTADDLLTIQPSETPLQLGLRNQAYASRPTSWVSKFHPIIHENSFFVKESEKKSLPSKPSNFESGNNEDNLFCTPEEYTLKGCCICLLSRCFMIFAHFVMFLSFLANTMKSCTCTDCTKKEQITAL